MQRRILLPVALVTVLVLTLVLWPASDSGLTEDLVGTWRAVDPDNATLHLQREGVKGEEARFLSDGTVSYHLDVSVPPASSATTRPAGAASAAQVWGWKVQKGRLLLRDLGEGSTQEWMKPLRFSLSDTKLSVHRKGFPAKEFSRIN